MGADHSARRLARLAAAGRTVLGDADASAQCATLGAWRVLAASAVAASVKVTTTETALATATLPGEAMGVHGILRVTSLWSHTNSADLKSLRPRLPARRSARSCRAAATASVAAPTAQPIVQSGQLANTGKTITLGPFGVVVAHLA